MYFIHIYNIELKKEKENRWKEKSTCFNTLKVKMTMEPQDGGHSNHHDYHPKHCLSGRPHQLNTFFNCPKTTPRVRFPDFNKIMFQDNTWIIIYYDSSIKLLIPFL